MTSDSQPGPATTSDVDRRAAIREQIKAKYQAEIATWRATQADLPVLSEAEYNEVQRTNWLDGVRAYDPEASLDG